MTLPPRRHPPPDAPCPRVRPLRAFDRALARLPAGALALALLAGPASARADEPQEEEKVLNIYNWSDYIAPDTIANFEKETGIHVRYDNFDTNEILHAKLIAGKTDYDIVVPSSYWAHLQMQEGLFMKLDKARIPNLKNVEPAIASQLAHVDPGNLYFVDWLWGYTTLGINVDKVKAALGDMPLPENAWDLVFKPAYADKLKSCGMSFVDSGDEVISVALHYLGRPRVTTRPADYEKVHALLKAIRPDIVGFSSSSYIDDLAKGSVCVALGWSGDIGIARQRALEKKTGQTIQALVPETGGLLFFDVMAVPKAAPHPRNAMKWIDYILRPEVDAELTNHVFYANPNRESRKYVLPRLATDPILFPSPDSLRHMVNPPETWTNDARRLQKRAFAAFKTGL